jgi:carbamate kinase
VPSPEPRSVVELATIRLFVDAGVFVVCVGGGGSPSSSTATAA